MKFFKQVIILIFGGAYELDIDGRNYRHGCRFRFDLNEIKTDCVMKLNTISMKIANMAFLFLFLLIPELCFADKLADADSFFNDGAFTRAIPLYLDALVDNAYSLEQKTEINYALGTAYFLIQETESSVKYWRAAKAANPRVHDGRIFRIPSTSMQPQLIKGDMIIVNNNYFKHMPIRRFDVVTFVAPSNPKNIYVKRVIGLPGELIEIRERKILINGKEISEPLAVNFDKNAISSLYDDVPPVAIPMNKYFLMGDNWNNSLDSRHFGAIEKSQIKGKALAIYGTLTGEGDHQSIGMERARMLIN